MNEWKTVMSIEEFIRTIKDLQGIRIIKKKMSRDVKLIISITDN